MENCFVTKLKDAVNDTTIGKLGILKVSAWNFGAGNNLMQFDVADDYTANFKITDNHSTISQAIGACVVVDTKHGIIKPKGNNTYNGFRVPVNSGLYIDYEVEKYHLKSIYQVVDFNISELEYMYDLKEFICYDGGNGDISVFKGKDMVRLEFSVDDIPNAQHIGVVGNVVDALGGCVNLSRLTLSKVNVDRFDIEDFVAAQRSAGRTATESPILLTQGYAEMYYNGEKIANGKHNLSWTASAITLTSV